jgi:hypothetical protein
MKLSGRGDQNRVQDSSLIQVSLKLRETLESRWRFIYRPVYFVIGRGDGGTFDEEDLHDWELELLPNSLIASFKLTPERFIVGISTGKKPSFQEDFSTEFIRLLNQSVEVSEVQYQVEAYGRKKRY